MYESYGNRGLYSNGWEMVSRFRLREGYSDQYWKLYHLARISPS